MLLLCWIKHTHEHVVDKFVALLTVEKLTVIYKYVIRNGLNDYVRRRIVSKFKQSLNQSIFMSKGTFSFLAMLLNLTIFSIRKYPYIYIQQFISNPYLFRTIQPILCDYIKENRISNIKIYANYAQMKEVKMKNNNNKKINGNSKSFLHSLRPFISLFFSFPFNVENI